MPVPVRRRFFGLAWLAPVALAACVHTAQTADADDAAPPATAQTLTAYHWHLRQAFARDGTQDASWFLPERPPLQIVFSAQGLSVNHLCNSNGSAYSLQGSRITVQQGIATMMACQEGQIMQLEQRVMSLLPQAQQWSISMGRGQQPPRLTLTFADGSRWQLEGEATPATRYGSAGEQVFWEVAAQRTSCAQTTHTCLRVREIGYDRNGHKVSTGAWQDFDGAIEGWQHEPGLRSVLRLRRYQQPKPAAGQQHVYVLDMVVESALEKR